MNDKWKKIDAKWLLAKNGKLNLDQESKIPDEVIDQIANAIEDKPGDYEVPEEHQTDLLKQSFPTPKTRIRVANAETDTKAMIDKYVKQNGSLIVPDGEDVEDFKKKLESGGDSDGKLICG